MVTMREVAELAGVSITTVSHVINSTRSVAPDTRTRVLDAIDLTGYTGDAIARSLVTGGTKSIGVALPLNPQPLVGQLIQAIEQETARAGYAMVLTDTRDEPEAERLAVRTLRSRRVDGIILAPSPGADGAVLPELRKLALPTVLVDRLSTSQDVDQVGPENVQAISALVLHLAEHGHRRIGMVSGPADLATNSERVLGYRLGLGRAGLTWDESLVGYSDQESANVTALLGRPDPPTALIAGSDSVLAGLLRTVRARGLRVGADLAVVAFGEVEWADLVDPAITTMAPPVADIGQSAVRMLLDRIGDPALPARSTRLPPTLLARQSCGCP
jgi:LacI family transcriptional regulator